jgi:myo-inositol-1(or 4)-monophosphatase
VTAPSEPCDLDVALAVSAAAAEQLLKHYRPSGVRDTARSKGERRNLVTAADLAAERAALAQLAVLRPGDSVIAEESAGDGPGGSRCWYVDPLDGTNNFAQGIPLFCVSVGLVEDGEPTVGVIHAPVIEEVYAVGPGSPPSLNGGSVQVSATTEMADAICATGFAYDRERIADDNVDNFRSVLMSCRGMRRCGAAALDLAWVAAGRLDAFWELWLNPWDVAAGAALVRAAGGRVTDMIGGDDWLQGRHIIAGNGALHEPLLGLLSRPTFAR